MTPDNKKDPDALSLADVIDEFDNLSDDEKLELYRLMSPVLKHVVDLIARVEKLEEASDETRSKVTGLWLKNLKI